MVLRRKAEPTSRVGLELHQFADGRFAIDTEGDAGAVIEVAIGSGLETGTAMVEVLDRVARQEVLHEGHVHFTRIRRQHHVPIAGIPEEGSPETPVAAVAKRFGVRIGLAPFRIEIGVRAGDIARGFLVQIDHRETAVELYAAHVQFVEPGKLLLIRAAVRLVAHFLDAVEQEQVADAFVFGAELALYAPGSAGAGLDRQQTGFTRLGQHDIDHAVHGVGAPEGAARTAHDLDASGVLGVGIEHLVDVAEGVGANRNAVLGHEKSAASPGAGEHGRADRSQAFLAVVAIDVDAGYPV